MTVAIYQADVFSLKAGITTIRTTYKGNVVIGH
jgi:hypothetical protein